MDAAAMRPGDGDGGEGSADAPAASGIGADNLLPPYSGYFSLLLSQVDMARTVRPDDCGATAASVQADFDDLINPSSRLELADIWGTHHSVNQTANHGLDSQMEVDSNGYMEENADIEFQDEGFPDEASESDHYEELFVRCEGDTDVEDLYPTPVQTVVEDVISKAQMRKETRVKQAKRKAEMSRAAKRKALEGDVEEQGMTFSDQVSDDCKELVDSSDDDQVVDGNDVSSITKKRSKAKKPFKRAYYDESRLNAHDQFQINMCFEDVHLFRRALLNYHVVHQRD